MKLPPRDNRGRFRKRKPLPPRDSKGRFATKAKAKRRQAQVKGLKQPEFHKPSFNLCLAADREDFYGEIRGDYAQLAQKLSPEDFTSIRLVFDVQGKPKKKRGQKRRKSTAHIGKRTFRSLRPFKRFLLLDTGESSGRDRENPNGLDWSKKGLCQYSKSARLEIAPETGRGRTRILRRYKLESQ